MSSVQHPSGQDRTFRIRDVAAYLGVTHQRVSMMYAEDKLPEPERVDGIGPLWKPAMIERWAKREWWGTRRWRQRPG
jgi:predicted DNA-binding transcriptional regulator AlpA